jgi:hypothetical protein
MHTLSPSSPWIIIGPPDGIGNDQVVNGLHSLGTPLGFDSEEDALMFVRVTFMLEYAKTCTVANVYSYAGPGSERCRQFLKDLSSGGVPGVPLCLLREDRVICQDFLI